MPPRHIRSSAPAAALLAFGMTALAAPPARAQGSDQTPFTLSSLASQSGGMLSPAQVNSAHGCTGGNSAPALQWSAVPHGAKSLALTMFDSTARNGAGFWHWALFDVPAAARGIDLGQVPAGAKAGRNGFGDIGYGGACPPPGQMHQYHFAVWALPDDKLPFEAGAPDDKIGAYLSAHALGHAELVFMYRR